MKNNEKYMKFYQKYKNNETKNVILSDNLFISDRLSELDSGYVLVRNSEKYELHNIFQPCDSYCLTFPFSEIDERMIDYARYTRVDRMNKVISYLDAENDKRERNICSALFDYALEAIYDS